MSGRRLRLAAAATAAMLLVFVAFFGCMRVDSAKGGEPPTSAVAVSRQINISSDAAAELSANAGTDTPSRGCDCGGADPCATNAIQQKAEVRASAPQADSVETFGTHEDVGAAGAPQTRPPGVRSATTTLAMHCVWRT